MYLPFIKDQKFLYMGLNRLDISDWFEPDIEWLEFYRHKKSVHSVRRHQTVFQDKRAGEAVKELHTSVLDNLKKYHTDTFEISDRAVLHRASGTSVLLQDTAADIAQTGLLVQDDLCLLQDSPQGYRLTAASLCAPSYWHLEDKVGQTIDEIHSPLPGYQAGLSRSMNRFFDRMKVGLPVWRANWSIAAHAGLMQRLDTPTPGHVDEDPLWLRVERQTLVKLPESGAICFTIRIHRYPLEDVVKDPGIKSALVNSLNQMSKDELEYKSLAPILPRLQKEWAELEM